MTLPPPGIQCTNQSCQKYIEIQNVASFNITEVSPGQSVMELGCGYCGTIISWNISRAEFEDYDNLIKAFHCHSTKAEVGTTTDADESPDTHSLSDYYLSHPDPLDDTHLGAVSQAPISEPRQLQNAQQAAQQPSNDSPKDHHVQFLDAIDAIDKNLPKIEQFNKITEALDVILGAPPPVILVCMDELKTKFHLTARDVEGFRKTLTQKQKEFTAELKRVKNEKLLDQCTREPKILTDEEKKNALAYLQHPNLVKNISRDIAYAGNLIGEENNKMMLYFASISRKLDKPISLVIFGKSSSGKSYLANTIEEFIPPEDSLSLSSSSGRGFEYLGSQLQHKCVLIQEWEGAENILPTIRTLQSEGKLNRLVTVDDPDSPNQRKSVAMSFKCPCSVVITTTQENIYDENSTRIFELYADESVAQTENIVRASVENADLSKKSNKKEKEKIVELQRDVQRCLEKIDVSIPFADKLTFPKNTTRHRRDVNRFLQLVKVVGFLHQKQKFTIENNGNKYIEADLRDYAIAYNYGIPILKNTLNKISQRAKDALVVCCALADEKGKAVSFTTKEIQEKAPQLGCDFNNRNDLYKQLNVLTEFEYLDYDQTRKGTTKYYTVCFDYVRSEDGTIINASSAEFVGSSLKNSHRA